MGVPWLELQETPAYIVQDYIAVMEAEARAAGDAERRRESERKR